MRKVKVYSKAATRKKIADPDNLYMIEEQCASCSSDICAEGHTKAECIREFLEMARYVETDAWVGMVCIDCAENPETIES